MVLLIHASEINQRSSLNIYLMHYKNYLAHSPSASGYQKNYLFRLFYYSIIIIYHSNFIMENLNPKCSKNNMCSLACSFKNCQKTPFMCNNDDCQCRKNHQNCTSQIKWQKIKEIFQNKLENISDVHMQYFQQVQDLYKITLREIERSYAQQQQFYQTSGLSNFERNIYKLIEQKKYAQINGALINKLQMQLSNQNHKDFSIKIQSKQKEKQEIKIQTKNLITLLQNLTKLEKVDQIVEKKNSPLKQQQISLILNSTITQDIATVSSFFNKTIKDIKLLYRASENNFQVSKFWERCNNKFNTLTLIRTQFGKIIGGYTPLSWKTSFKDKWQVDNKYQSFIFSITDKQKLPLMRGKQGYAIYHRLDYGPIFGNNTGSDIYICDKANQKPSSGNSLYSAYKHMNYQLQADQTIWKKFNGQKNGKTFKTQQWEVHQIIFE